MVGSFLTLKTNLCLQLDTHAAPYPQEADNRATCPDRLKVVAPVLRESSVHTKEIGQRAGRYARVYEQLLALLLAE